MMQRFEKEKFVSIESITAIQHTAARPGIDASWGVLYLFAFLMVYKFVLKESDPDDKVGGQIIGAVGMLFALFGRNVLGRMKRRFM